MVVMSRVLQGRGVGVMVMMIYMADVRWRVELSWNPFSSSAPSQVGVAIEKALGSAQDVEGVVDQGGNITVVQTRPQM